jgi:deoxyribonuclease-4
MGKQNQLGTLSEVLSLCTMSKWVIPAVDFGHLHAVTQGKYVTVKEYEAVFDAVGETLGQEIAQNLHIHFSKIEFTKAGEKRHWTFADPYGPPYECLVKLIANKGYTPRIICESAGTQAKDAKMMQDMYLSMANLNK